MGTLGGQPPRNEFHRDLDSFLKDLADLCKKHDVAMETVIEAKKVLELERQNNIAVQNGDYHDEQMGGLGDILQQISGAIESLKQ